MIPPPGPRVPEPSRDASPQQVNQGQDLPDDRFVDFPFDGEVNETVDLTSDEEEDNVQAELAERASPEGQILEESVVEVPVTGGAVSQDAAMEVPATGEEANQDNEMDVAETEKNAEANTSNNTVKVE